MLSGQIELAFDFFPDEINDWVTIELTHANGDVPLHLSLRQDSGHIVVNSRVAGQWGGEAVFPVTLDSIGLLVIEIVVENDTAEIYVDGTGVGSVVGICHIESGYSVETVLRRATILPQQRIPTEAARQVVLSLAAPRAESSTLGFVEQEITLAGHSLVVPDLDPGGLAYIHNYLLPFLASRALSSDGLMFDLSGTSGLVSVLLARLFSTLVIASCETQSELDRIRALAARNAVNRVVPVLNTDVFAAVSACGLGSDREASEPQPERIASLLAGAAGNPTDTNLLSAAYLLAQHAVSATFSRGKLTQNDPLAEALASAAVHHKVGALMARETDSRRALNTVRGAVAESELMIGTGPFVIRRDRFGAQGAHPWTLDITVAMYNTEKYVEECVGSLLASGRPDIKVTVIDDGSTDSSVAAIQRHFGQHPNLTVVSKPNGGCASARNYGRTVTDGAFVAFVDADDWVDPELFPTLLDAALATGAEVVQGGFAFVDGDTREETPSYEPGIFAGAARMRLADYQLFKVPAQDLISGQPSVWRRIYRRDFLDNRGLSFPEHIRAFDDMFFHLLSVYYARDIYMVDGPTYKYRQHAGQDIKQGDERHLYELEIYRMLLKRALREGWNDFHLFVPSIINTANWSLVRVREDLVTPYLEGLAELWTMIERCFGAELFGDHQPHDIRHPDFRWALERARETTLTSRAAYGMAFLDSMVMQPSLLNLARKLRAVT